MLKLRCCLGAMVKPILDTNVAFAQSQSSCAVQCLRCTFHAVRGYVLATKYGGDDGYLRVLLGLLELYIVRHYPIVEFCCVHITPKCGHESTEWTSFLWNHCSKQSFANFPNFGSFVNTSQSIEVGIPPGSDCTICFPFVSFPAA